MALERAMPLRRPFNVAGRLIVYGKKQAANPNRVGGFVLRLACFAVAIAIFCVLYQLMASHPSMPLDVLPNLPAGPMVLVTMPAT